MQSCDSLMIVKENSDRKKIVAARLQDQYHKLIIPLIKSEQSFDYAGPALGIPVWDFNQKLIFYQKPNLSFKRPKLVAPS